MQFYNKKITPIFIATASALSGILFGYDVGVMASAMLFIQKDFHLSAQQAGLVVSLVPFGALLASMLSSKINQHFGRKKSLWMVALLFIVGTLISVFSSTVIILMFGRLLLGIAIGMGSCISPVYTAELSDEKHRGSLVNIFVLMIQSGIFLSFMIGHLFSLHGAWRLMMGVGLFPAVLLLACVALLPESPRWLVMKGKQQEAFLILKCLTNDTAAKRTIDSINRLVMRDSQQRSLKWITSPIFLKCLWVGILVSFFTQTVGINMLNYYAPMIFQQSGFSTPQQSTAMTMLMGLMLVISTTASLFFVDRVGRRRLLLFAMKGILTSLLLIACAFLFIRQPAQLGWTVFIGTLIFMLFHGAGIGPACFLIPAEIFPIRMRELGMGISVASNWGANVLVAACVPIGLLSLGPANLFLLFFFVSAMGYILFWLFVPETKGMSLESIEQQMHLSNQYASNSKPIR
ncbi:MAG: sugar porter family MFS transporter [Gammaproteobacteria bacterium]|nr:sugar porter family MFS transporter [Gammaproteobacteria bacterium]